MKFTQTVFTFLCSTDDQGTKKYRLAGTIVMGFGEDTKRHEFDYIINELKEPDRIDRFTIEGDENPDRRFVTARDAMWYILKKRFKEADK